MKIAKLVVAVILAGGLWGYFKIDTARNYTPVSARVTAARMTCYVVSKERAHEREDRADLAIANLSCERLKTLPQHRQRDYRQRYKSEVQFTFRSPVDGSIQKGHFEREKLRNKVSYIAPGNVIEIHAHNTIPDRYKR